MKKIFAIDETYNSSVKKYTRKDALIALGIYILLLIVYYMMGQVYMHKGIYIAIEGSTALALLCIIVIKFRGQSLGSIGFTKRNLKRTIILGTVLGVVILVLNNFGNVISGKDMHSIYNLLRSFIYYFLGISLVEEVIFRGYLQTRMYGIINKKVFSILLVAFLFMIMHIPFQMGYAGVDIITYIVNNWITLLFTFIWHIVFNFLYMKYNSIIAPTIFHGFLDWSNYIF